MSLQIKSGGVWISTGAYFRVSGTWRRSYSGSIKVSGTWRNFLSPGLGTVFGGGRVFCKSTNRIWIVSAATTEVYRNWYCKEHAITLAQAATGCTDWFIPDITTLTNGYYCRAYWDCHSCPSGGPDSNYWSSTCYSATAGWAFCFACGVAAGNSFPFGARGRAFRCVSY